MSILVGDIGGTHCRLAMATVNGLTVSLADVHYYQNADYADLASIMAHYLANTPAPTAACLAVAGPTDGRQVHFTNLDWHIDTGALEAQLGLKPITLVNDFTAVGWGINALGPNDIAILQAGLPAHAGVKAAVGAGTGLGVSIGIPHQDLHQPIPTEGGHIGFAPLDAQQDRLLAFLREQFGRVSVERLLSGPGIVDLYRFCAQDAGHGDTALLDAPVPAQAVTQAALEGSDGTAVQTMALFASVYGQVAGDIALLTRAQGGIYLAGGIPPKILPLLQKPNFLAGFHTKGRFSDWMQTVPVAVVLDTDIGLRGAALAATALTSRT